MAERIDAAAEAAREADRIALKEMRALSRQSNAAINKAVGTFRAKEDQHQHMFYAIGRRGPHHIPPMAILSRMGSEHGPTRLASARTGRAPHHGRADAM